MRLGGLIIAVMLIAACGDDAEVPLDAGTADVGAATDASTISDASTGADSGVSDSGTPSDGGPWAHCPSSTDYVGEISWQNSLVVTPDATYCGTFNESRTLLEEWQSKAKLHIVPSTDYPIPADMGSHPFFLPVCVDFNNGAPPTPETPGTIDHSVSVFNNTANHQNAIRMFFDDQGTRRLFLMRVYMEGPVGTPVSLTLDGTTSNLVGGGGGYDISLCGGELENECYGLGSVFFDSCTHEGSDLHRHDVDFTGGSIELDLRIGVSFASTEPGAFVRAAGTYQGTAFEQLDYWKLVYSPDHHHFARDFAVFFDSPIAGACGLEVTRLEPFGDTEPDHVYTIDCGLNRIAELTVTNATWQNLGP